jgi:hypothetical protein
MIMKPGQVTIDDISSIQGIIRLPVMAHQPKASHAQFHKPAHLQILGISAACRQRHIQVAPLELMGEGLGSAVQGEREDRGVVLKDGGGAITLRRSDSRT